MSRKLGQHFLRSDRIIRIVADSLDVPPRTAIVEIGPGRGVLTRHLLNRERAVIAVEKDPHLVEVLNDSFADEIAEKRLILISGDARSDDWTDAVRSMKYVVIANIPFYITGSFVRKILSRENPPSAMSLVVQKEVAERIAARNGKESLLSLSVKLFGTPSYRMKIPRSAFRPVPAVDSALISITDIRKPPQSVQDVFFSVIHTAFSEKRKTVLKKFAHDEGIQRILVDCGVVENSRAEDVPFSAWLAVAHGGRSDDLV